MRPVCWGIVLLHENTPRLPSLPLSPSHCQDSWVHRLHISCHKLLQLIQPRPTAVYTSYSGDYLGDSWWQIFRPSRISQPWTSRVKKCRFSTYTQKYTVKLGKCLKKNYYKRVKSIFKLEYFLEEVYTNFSSKKEKTLGSTTICYGWSGNPKHTFFVLLCCLT